MPRYEFVTENNDQCITETMLVNNLDTNSSIILDGYDNNIDQLSLLHPNMSNPKEIDPMLLRAKLQQLETDMERITDPRQLKGLVILTQGGVRNIFRNMWEVQSQSGNGKYGVSKTPNGYTCTCEDFVNYQTKCKHIHSVILSQELEKYGIRERKVEIKEPETPDYTLCCPYCESDNIIKRGKRKTGYGENQVYGCKDCGKRFTPDMGFKRMKHSPEAITLVLDLYFKGLSFRKIVDHLKQFHGINVDHTTPLRWVKKYIKVISKYVEKQKANVGNIWHSDEMTVFIREDDKTGNYEWIWNVMDAETRYLLACEVSETRYVKDAKVPLQKAKDIAQERPDVVITDGLQAYGKAMKDVFYDRGARINNPHIRMKDFKTKPNNNMVERLNGTFRERTKIMRGLDSEDGAVDFTRAYQVYYNYLRPHSGIGGMCPAQAAGLPVGLDGNRWKRMIELASARNQNVVHQEAT